MAVDDLRMRVRRSLEEKLGVDEATYLMDRPPGGWSDLVTLSTLDARLDAVEARLTARMDRLDSRMDGFDEKLSAMEARLTSEIERRFRIQTAYLVVALAAVAGILKI